MFLDGSEHGHVLLAVHHVDGQASLAEAARPADPVQVGLVVRVAVFVQGEVEVDHHGNLLYVDPCWAQIIAFFSLRSETEFLLDKL